MPNAYDYLWDDVIQTKKGLEGLMNSIGSSPERAIRAAMHAANNKVNSSYPIAHEFMARSIDGKGAVSYKSGSKIAKAILDSSEFKKLAKAQSKKACGKVKQKKVSVLFSSNRDLARSIYAAAVQGEFDISAKGWSFKGTVTDTYDFRFDLIPKKLTVKGVALRYAGNLAYVCQTLGLMSTYKVTVQLDGSGKF